MNNETPKMPSAEELARQVAADLDAEMGNGGAITNAMDKIVSGEVSIPGAEKVREELQTCCVNHYPDLVLGEPDATVRSMVEQCGVYDKKTGEHLADITAQGSGGIKFTEEFLLEKLATVR